MSQESLSEYSDFVKVATGIVFGTFIAVKTIHYLMPSKAIVAPIVDLKNQTKLIDETTQHRTSWQTTDEYPYFNRITPDVKTVYSSLEKGKSVSNNGPCLGTRKGDTFEWMSYQEVIDKVHQFGSGLVNKGFQPQNDVFIGIFATNCAEWLICDYGSQAYSMTPVALYDTLGVEACEYIIKECKISAVFVDTPERVDILLKIKPNVPSLSLLILLDPVSEEVSKKAESMGLSTVTFGDFLKMGRENLIDPVPQKPEDTFSICYTSGTTGNPKGAMLTNNNMVVMVDMVNRQIASNLNAPKDQYPFNQSDVHLSYLPLAHQFERAMHVTFLIAGARIGYFSKDIKLLIEDLGILKPTVFPSVPRLLNRLYDAVYNEVKGSKLKSTMLKWALNSKFKEVKNLVLRRNTIWDKLIFSKLQNRLGGRVRMVISGAAPLAPEVLDFLRCALGCVVLEGYGQTEAGAGISLTVPGDYASGECGPPLPGVHLKLADVPEMEYYAKDGIGELCCKGPNVFQGYYKNPEKTAEALDQDGWLHTGDVVRWTSTGTIKVVDRKKHIFKLQQGEYVAPEKIENVYRSSPFIAQCFVDGNSNKSNLMAVVVPDEEYLAKWAPNNNFPSSSKEFCAHAEAKTVIKKDMQEIAKKANLKGFEQVKEIHLDWNLFSVENELLTPTFKNKRAALRKKYNDAINNLYEQNDSN